MKLLADASLEAPVVGALRAAGHDVVYVPDIDPRMADPDVLRTAEAQGRVLLTYDKDFGELFFRDRAAAPGVLFMRFGGEKGRQKAPVIVRIIESLGDRLVGRFTVASRGATRSRPLR